MQATHECMYVIDFGTTNSLMCAVWKDRTELLPIDPNNTDPTILRTLLFTPSQNIWYTGSQAIAAYYEHDGEGRFFRSIKKFLADQNFSKTNVHERLLSLEEIVAVFLRQMKTTADKLLNLDVKKVVLGRPALFDLSIENDRLAEKRLHKAATLAGFSEIHFCPEPIAAAFDFQSELNVNKNVLIADFGGGTSDFTILKMGPSKFKKNDVLSLNGIFIAGDAFDGRIMKKSLAHHFGSNVHYQLPMSKNEILFPKGLLEKICTPAYIPHLRANDIRVFLEEIKRFSLSEVDKKNMDQLFALVDYQLGYDIFSFIEKAKIELSSKETTNFTYIRHNIEVKETITRTHFESYSSELVAAIMERLDFAVKDSGLSYSEIDLVCATGGSAKMPILASELIKRFGKDKISDYKNFHSIILGLAKYAQQEIL